MHQEMSSGAKRLGAQVMTLDIRCNRPATEALSLLDIHNLLALVEMMCTW
jgi:hypothetical protein